MAFSAIGYQNDTLIVNIKGDSVRVDIKLRQSSNSLEMVSINAIHQHESMDIKQGMVLNGFEVATTAGAVADIAGALRTLPGAAPQSNQTGFYVRGGDANETGAYMDGMLLKNPFGSKLPDIANRSRFSPFMFKETTFSAGGYSAEYGEALSSLLLYETKDLPDNSSNEFTLLTLGAGAAHMERMQHSAYLIGANYFNFNPNDNVDPQNVDWVKNPEQKQATFEYKWQPEPLSMFKVLADYSDTRLSLNVLNPDSLVNDLVKNTNENFYLNTTYEGFLNDSLKLKTGISFNRTTESGAINTTPYHQDDNVLHAKATLTKYISKKSNLLAGAELFANGRNEGYGDTVRKYNDILAAGFLEGEFSLTNKLTARIGGRAEYSRYLDNFLVSPRATLIYKLTRHDQVRATYGIFYQKPDDSYLTQTKNLDDEKATHYIVGYEHNQDETTFRIEAYYKDYGNLTKLTTPVYSGLRSFGDVIINGFAEGGSGYARGFDVFWRDKKTIPFGEYYISYSFVDSRRDYLDYPAFARPPFAPEHTLNAVIRKYYADIHTQLSATYTIASGRTYYNPLSPVFLGDKAQLYNNLSTTISYLPMVKNSFTVINFTVSNIPGFNQVFGYRYSATGLNREPILPTSRRYFVLSLLINIGDATFNYD